MDIIYPYYGYNGDMDLLLCFRSLTRVVERGSLSRAALDLGLAQASVTRHLQQLERRYGTALIHRTTRSARVTPAGISVYEFARSVLASEAQLAESVQKDASQLAGGITVAAPTGFGHEIIAPFVIDFAKRHPESKVRLRLSERLLNLLEEGIDVAIRIGAPNDSSMYAMPLGTLREVLVGAPSLCLGRRLPLATEEIGGLPRVALEGASDSGSIFMRGRKRYKLDTPVRMVVDSSLALRAALLEGLGVGVIHEYLVAKAIRERRLVELLPDWQLPDWPVNAIYPTRDRAARVTHFAQELRIYLRQQLPAVSEP
jgi:DNA-binding transcriptional LysR family regulator